MNNGTYGWSAVVPLYESSNENISYELMHIKQARARVLMTLWAVSDNWERFSRRCCWDPWYQRNEENSSARDQVLSSCFSKQIHPSTFIRP